MVLETKNGFSIPVGQKMLFIETEKQTKCKAVIDATIKGICDYRAEKTGQSWTETMNRALADNAIRKDIAYRLQKTTYELRETDEKHMRYISLIGSNFGGGYDEDEIVMVKFNG